MNADQSSRSSWKLVRVSADRIELNDPFWREIVPRINIYGKTLDSKSYEVVLLKSEIQKLLSHTLGVNLSYDPTTAIKEHISAYGTEVATRKAQTDFLRNAAATICSGYSYGYEECCREVAHWHDLTMLLKRAILIHDILVSSSTVEPGCY